MSPRTAALPVALVVAITIGAGSAAFAHANYARSDPAPDAQLSSAPTRVVVDFTVTVTRGGSPLPNVTRVRLRITPLDRDIGLSEIILAVASQPATYGGSGYELPFAGRYKVEVQVRRSDTVDDLAFDFETAVATPTPSPSPSLAAASPAASTSLPSSLPSASSFPGASVVLGALAVLVLVIAVALARRRA